MIKDFSKFKILVETQFRMRQHRVGSTIDGVFSFEVQHFPLLEKQS